MGLYDQYRLENSRTVKQYQGSAVPEMVAVSQEMQKRYDTSQDRIDYANQYLNSMTSLSQDSGEFNKVKAQFTDSLATLGKRPDLENAVRESTMLANKLPQEYAPFAQRMKDLQERKGDYDKKVSDGKLDPAEAQRLLKRDIALDGGIKKDPVTGKYNGRFTGQQYVDSFDMQKAVDTIMDKQFPVTQGWKREQVGDKWIFSNGAKTVTLGPDRIKAIVSTGLQNDFHAMGWIQQQQNLGTYDIDRSAVDPSTLSLSPDIQQRLAKGETLTSIAKEGTANQITSGIIGKAHAYAVNKYQRHDSESASGVSVNSYGLDDYQKKEPAMMQMASTMTLGGAKVEDVKDFDTIINGAKTAITDNMTSYADWTKGINDGREKFNLGSGRVGYKDENGKMVDVTADAQAFRSQISYAKEKEQQLTAVDDASKRAANYYVTPALKKQAQIAYDKEMRGSTPGGALASAGGNDKVRAQRAYNNILEATPEYKKYQQELTRRMTGTTVGSDLFNFMDEAKIKTISASVEGLIAGLGLKNGIVPVQDKDGKQLSADDWKELQGNMRAIGVTYTGDPNSPIALVVRGFKDVKGKKTNGEDMIVKLPNTNIMAIAAPGMDQTQQDYLRRASGLAVAVNNASRSFTEGNVSVKANTEDPRGGWTIKVGAVEKTAYSFKEIFEFMDANHK